jgi:GxxExxY protein
MTEGDLIYREETFAIRGACFEVYKEKGSGFLESVYQECLQLELQIRNIPVVPQPKLALAYKGQTLQTVFQPDLLCYGTIVVELKALDGLTDACRAQLHNYLRATGYRLGLLVNFGHYPGVEIERIIR